MLNETNWPTGQELVGLYSKPPLAEDIGDICIIMAALRSRCGHYIFALWFLLSSFFFCSFLA